MKAGLSAVLITVYAVTCSATISNDAHLDREHFQDLTAVGIEQNHVAFESSCAKLSSEQVRYIFDHLTNEELKRLLSKKCTSHIQHWELIKTIDVEEGRLDSISLSTLKIDSFGPDVLLALLRRKNFQVDGRTSFCENNSFKKFLEHPSWSSEPRLMTLLDETFMRQAISDQCAEPKWSRELFIYYNEMDFSLLRVSDMAHWILRSNQLLQVLALDKVHHARALAGNLKARTNLLESVKRKRASRSLVFLLSIPIGFHLQKWLNSLDDIVKRQKKNSSSDHGIQRAHPKVIPRALQALDTHFKLTVTCHRKSKTSSSHQQLPSIHTHPSRSLSRSLTSSRPRQSQRVALCTYDNQVEEIFHHFQLLVSPHMNDDQFNCADESYWTIQLLLNVVGSRMPPLQAHFVELFNTEFRLSEEDARGWIECALSRGNIDMLDLGLKHICSATILEFLQHEIQSLSDGKRNQLFWNSSNKMVQRFASLLPRHEDPIVIARNHQMIELKFTFDHYPSLEDVSNSQHEGNNALFLEALYMLDNYAAPFAHPQFMIAYNMQTGQDGSAIMNEWLIFMISSMTSSDKRFFITSPHPISKQPCFLPAEFVDPKVMAYFGLLVGKFWQKGFQMPVDIHPYFWHMLLDEDWICDSLALKNLLPSAFKQLNEMRRLDVESIKRIELPSVLSYTTLDQLHFNYSESGQDDVFQPNNPSEVASYFENWEGELMNLLSSGRDAFRSTLSFFVDLKLIRSDSAQLLPSLLYDSAPLSPHSIVSRLSFQQADNVTVVDDLNEGQNVGFADAFIMCLLNLNSDQLSKLLMFWTGSNRLPVGGYHALKLHVKCLVSESTGFMTSSSCFKQLKCPAYKSVSTMLKYMLDSIANGFNSGFEDEQF